MKSLKEECNYGTATSVYRKNVTDILPENLAVLQPRNARQVKNIRSMVQGNSDFHIRSIQSS